MSSQRFPPDSIAVSLFTNRETAMLSNFHTTQHVIPFKACQKIVGIIIIHCADSQVSFDKLISSRKKNYLRKEKKMEKLVIRLVCWGKRCQQVSCPGEKQLNSWFLSNQWPEIARSKIFWHISASCVGGSNMKKDTYLGL